MRHTCTIENASLFWGWIKNRQGVAVWNSIDLSDPGKSWSTPAVTRDGIPTDRPTRQAAKTPAFVVVDPKEIDVCFDKEVKRFRIGVRMGDSGLKIKVTDKSTQRIRRAVKEAGEKAYYIFDYETQEVIIMKPDRIITLAQWAQEQGLS